MTRLSLRHAHRAIAHLRALQPHRVRALGGYDEHSVLHAGKDYIDVLSHGLCHFRRLYRIEMWCKQAAALPKQLSKADQVRCSLQDACCANRIAAFDDQGPSDR